MLPDDVDWAVLPPEIAEEIRWMPNRVRNIRDALASLNIAMPNYGDLFERRQQGYSGLGLRALDLIDGICSGFNIPAPERPQYFDPRAGFAEKIEAAEAFWTRRGKTRERVPPSSNVPPLFQKFDRRSPTAGMF